MRYQAVLFDLDGTLLNTLGDLADASNQALLTLGLPTHSEEAYRHFVGDGAHMLCIRMLPEDRRGDQQTVQELRAAFDANYSARLFDRTLPYPGVPQLLRRLKEAGSGLGVVSNKPDAFVRSIVERYFPGVFDAVSGQRGTLKKPDPTGVNQILSRLGLTPGEALYVGDSGVDIQTARNAGTHSCGVTWGFREEQELRENGAEFLVHSPSALSELIFNSGANPFE